MENEARGSAPSQRRGQQDRISEVRGLARHYSKSLRGKSVRTFYAKEHVSTLGSLWLPARVLVVVFQHLRLGETRAERVAAVHPKSKRRGCAVRINVWKARA